ncbi:MAG: MoxR family ATPase [Lachnospiraceae bacterium]|nr:MoxR family ATPase [Lachnospiraceae bacterium]
MNLEQFEENGRKLTENISRVIVGKEEVIKLLVTALIADGHVLLEDMPGTGKTRLARSLAASLNGKFARIQFTPDLLPSDVTGMNIFNRKTGEFELHKGPVFTNILLADEINRATPRTQAGLLESMEERQVTIDGVTFKLENPFFVIATQNPVETAGTFPLPEAQLDRFMMRLSVGLPSEAEEIAILDRFMKKDPGEELEAVVSLDELAQMRDAVREVYVHPEIEKYMVEIVAMTRKKDKVIMGVSPRGTLALLRAVKAYAALSGRSYCIPDDVKTLAVPVLSHRLKVNYGYQTEDDSRKVIEEILESVQTPTENFEG